MRVLVTGASGFICGSIIRALAARGHETIAAVRGGAGPVGAAATILWDFDGTRPEALPRDIDAIVHGAQSRSYRAFPQDGAAMFRVNVSGAWSVLDYAAEIGVRRFCLLSSGTVYEPYRGPLDETAPVAPTSFLGATKLATEVLARPYAPMIGLCVLRLFAPYGPGQQHRLIPDIADRVRTGRAVQLASDGNGLWLTPTHVDDIAQIVSEAICEGWTGTVNVAAPELVSLRQLAETIGDIIGRKPLFDLTDREPHRLAPILDQLGRRFDLSRFRRLQQGLRGVIAAE